MSGSRSVFLWMPLVSAIALVVACVGPPGPAGPPGPPGPPGAGSVTFYVVDGAQKDVAASANDVETISCDPGDAATGWTGEGLGLVAGPGVSGFRNVTPVLTGTTPSGFTFTFICTTNPTCEDLQHRVICADLTP